MGDYHVVFGVVAITVGFISFVPYFRDIFNGTTKPHVFTWLIWGVLVGVAFFVQIAEGGGIGAWATGVEALFCFTVAGLALSRGEKNITTMDWASLIGALLAMILWRVAGSPLAALLFVIAADTLGFVPTFRKGYGKPQEETVSQFALSALRWALSIFALQSFTLTTWLYPAFLVLLDSSLVAMLLLRRRKLGRVSV